MVRARSHDVIELSDSSDASPAVNTTGSQRRRRASSGGSSDQQQYESSDDSDFESRRSKSKNKKLPLAKNKNKNKNGETRRSSNGSVPVKKANAKKQRRRNSSNEWSSEEEEDVDDAMSQRMARRAPTPLFSEQVSLSELQAQEREFARLQRLSNKNSGAKNKNSSVASASSKPPPAVTPPTVTAKVKQPLLATTLARMQQSNRGSKRRLDELEEEDEDEHEVDEEDEESDDFEEDIVEAKRKALRASLALAKSPKSTPAPMKTSAKAPTKEKAPTPTKSSVKMPTPMQTPTKLKMPTKTPGSSAKTTPEKLVKTTSRVCKKTAFVPPPPSPSPPRRRSTDPKSTKNDAAPNKNQKKKAKTTAPERRASAPTQNKPTGMQKEIAALALAEPPAAREPRRTSGKGLLSDWLSVSEMQAQERAWSRLQVDLKGSQTTISKEIKVIKQVKGKASSRSRAESVGSDSSMSLVEFVELIEDDDDEQQGDEEDKDDEDDDFAPLVVKATTKKSRSSGRDRSGGNASASKSTKTTKKKTPSKPPTRKPAPKVLNVSAPRPNNANKTNTTNNANNANANNTNNIRHAATKLSKPRTAADTVPHGTTWRMVQLATSPPYGNLLPLAPPLLQPFESTADKPLVDYDPSGQLATKCELLASFGKTKSFVLTASDASATGEQPHTQQQHMNERVTTLLETYTPQIRQCYERKSDAIVQEARDQTRAYLKLRIQHRESIVQHATSLRTTGEPSMLQWTPMSTPVCAAERAMAKQLLIPRAISPLEIMDKLTIGRGDTFLVEKETVADTAVEMAPLRPICRSTTFTGIKSSVRVEDDPIMRYVPYFGDNDSGDAIDVKQYDAVRAKEAAEGAKTNSALENETNEYLLRLVVAECGDADSVFTALTQVAGFAQPHTEYVEIKKMRDTRRHASTRMREIRSFIGTKQAADDRGDDEATRRALALLTRDLYPFVAPMRSPTERVPLSERFAPHWTYFETHLLPPHVSTGAAAASAARERTTASSKFRRLLGLRHTTDYADLSETYRDLFCRMCYKYDCPDHGIEHPMPTRRVDPLYPPALYAPVAEKEENDEEAKQETKEKDEEETAKDETSSVEVSGAEPSAKPVVTVEVDMQSEDVEVEAVVVEDAASECSATTAESQDQLAPRRSARSGTRASTLSTISVESQWLAQGFKPRVPRVRAKPTPKQTKVDESEYLDDSHWPLVAAKVKTFVAATDACSAACWKAKDQDQDEQEQETGDQDKELRTGESAFDEPDERIQAKLNAAELLLLQKLRHTVGDNACMIAAVLQSPSVPCRDVHTYLVSQQRSKPSDQQGYFSPDVSGKKNRKRGRTTAALAGNNRELLKRTRNQRLKDKSHANHDYEPCNHDGICDFSVGCSCMKRDHMCEKACSCSRDCPNRFQGCRCTRGNCRTNACPCFVAMRECNPDLCVACGATEVPVLVFHEQLQKMSASDLGICCNVNVQRALHKQIGVSHSRTHGWGAFALEPIRRGEFIYEYTGAVVSHDEAERRGTIYDKLNISFLFDLNEDSVVDAIRTGNKSKFCNHANVNQKCHAKIMRVGGEHRISIWAAHDIAQGEELFFNYGYHGESAPVWSQGARITESSKREAAADEEEASAVAVVGEEEEEEEEQKEE